MTAPTDLCACGHPAAEHLWGYCTRIVEGKQCPCQGFEDSAPKVLEVIGSAA